jgi:trans-aconitate methyltransferase
MAMTDPYNTSKKFWTSADQYPNYGTTKQRRMHELNYLVPRLKGDTLVDLGCGDGALLNCLINLTGFNNFYGFDLSEKLMENLHPSIKRQVFDFYSFKSEDIPQPDVVIIAGAIAYIFDDDVVDHVLGSLSTDRLFLRVPCTLKSESELINNYSADLESEYASMYRTLPAVKNLISQHFDLVAVDRVYPDEIESNYGTKQYYIEGIKK